MLKQSGRLPRTFQVLAKTKRGGLAMTPLFMSLRGMIVPKQSRLRGVKKPLPSRFTMLKQPRRLPRTFQVLAKKKKGRAGNDMGSGEKSS